MLLLPIHTPLIRAGDDLAKVLRAAADIHPGDLIIVSSKAVATAEGAAVDLHALSPSSEAAAWSEKTGRSPAFCEAVLRETKRLRGRIIGFSPMGAILTEVQPEGLSSGVILVANAGMDESNVAEGYAIGWPKDPVASANNLRAACGGNPILLVDSVCLPRRKGVTAIALVAAGIDAFQSDIGKRDLFQKTMRYTIEARADQLAAAAALLMGNAAESMPAVIVRSHDFPLVESVGWVEGIAPADDLFRDLL